MISASQHEVVVARRLVSFIALALVPADVGVVFASLH
jgi:hypothetical protein